MLDVLAGLPLTELLNYGLGTALTVVFAIFILRMMHTLVNNQSKMIENQANTLREVATTLVGIKEQLKELQEGQTRLWHEVKNIKKNVFPEGQGGIKDDN